MEKPAFRLYKRSWFVLLIGFCLFLFLVFNLDSSTLSSERVAVLLNGFADAVNAKVPTKYDETVSNSTSTVASYDQHGNGGVGIVGGNEMDREDASAIVGYDRKGNSNVESVVSDNETVRYNNSATVTYDYQEDNDSKVEAEENYVEDTCLGRYIYIHQIPSKFNDDIIQDCRALVKWFDMCPFAVNGGLGPPVFNPKGVLLGDGWFATNQFFLAQIFWNRMKNYKCLTNNSSIASAIFVPYYAGFDTGRYLWGYNVSARDALGYDLTNWLRNKPEWSKMFGRDHFFVSGRISWDFRRQTDDDSAWGSKLMTLPETMNMTMLSIETTSWSNEFSIPYPTYFHPSSDREVVQWQNRMRKHRRRFFFAFAGAPRPGMNGSIRGEIIRQCSSGTRRTCNFLSCISSKKCDDPVEVIKVFRDSVFCLQPSGDSYTRRSIFDSIIAGCIPVFFHPFSAYAQYSWHLPKNYTKYSIFIPEKSVQQGKVSISERLRRISKRRVKEIREEVIKLIPNVAYSKPNSNLERFEDAFDIAVNGMLQRVQNVRKEIAEGKDVGIGFAKDNSWRQKLRGVGEEHEWDDYLIV